MNSNFFETNSYFIDEKVNILNFANNYKIYNDKGEIIGSVSQKLTTGQKVLRVFLKKTMLPFYLEIKNSNNEVEASISRGWSFFMSKIQIQDPQGNITGTIQQKFTFMKHTLNILNQSDIIIANLTGDWIARNYVIKDFSDVQIGSITKKWAGAAKEIFTTADKYKVNIEPKYSSKENKIAILSSAITIDMVYNERK